MLWLFFIYANDNIQEIIMENKTCEFCGEIYKPQYKGSKFCCRECYDKHRYNNMKRKYVICPTCGISFLQKRTNSIFCSTGCRIKSTEKRRTCKCEYCGKEFERIVSELEKNKHHFCSKDCKLNGTGWTKEEDNILIKNYGKLSYKDMTRLFNRKKTADMIKSRAAYIGITNSRIWTKEDIDILVNNYSNITFSELQSKLPHKTRASIIGKARTMGLYSLFYKTHKYTKYEEDYLRDNYLNLTNLELSNNLGRTENAISQHLLVMGLRRPSEKYVYDDLNRYVRARLTPWKNNYRKAKNYTCEISGVRHNIIVHHIRGINLLLSEAISNIDFELKKDMSEYSEDQLNSLFNEFIDLQEYYKEYVCVTEKIHKDFHKKYGYGDNTAEQWREYISDNYQ